MITRPVAVARALIVTALVWGLGTAVVVGLFSAFHASTTIDVPGQEDRAQVVWLGAHAFVACAAALLGICLGGSALTGAGLDAPRTAGLVVTAPTLVVGVVVALVVGASGALDSSTSTAVLVGLVIGSAAGLFFVVANGGAQGDVSFGGRVAPRGGRSWSSH